VVLNKADTCDQQTLMKVHGALMWSLSPVMMTPEATRVYTGSFKEGAYDERGRESFELFDKERADLLQDLHMLPRHNFIRKINTLIRRARLAKVHTAVMNHLAAQVGAVGKKKRPAKQQELFANIRQTFQAVVQAHDLSAGDMPDPAAFARVYAQVDFGAFQPVDPKLVTTVEQLLVKELPLLMRLLPSEGRPADGAGATDDPELTALREALRGPGRGWETCDSSRADSCRWQQEAGADSCPLCGAGFGMKTRKQHCRLCGVIACKVCTDEIPNQSDGGAAQRWCVGCKATSAV
jgi:hypothetical protein